MSYTRLLSGFLTLGVFSSALCADELIITGVFDGPIDNGPKGLEIYCRTYVPDMSIYGLGFAYNGGGTTGQTFTFPKGEMNPGSYVYIANDSDAFNTYFSTNPTHVYSSLDIDGNDAIELYKNDDVIDVFGEVEYEGTQIEWEYFHGWAYRNDGTLPNGGTFDISEFSLSGAKAITGCSTNSTCSSIIPLHTFDKFSGNHEIHHVTQVGSTFIPVSIGVKVGDIVRWNWTSGNHTVTSGTECTVDGTFNSKLNKSTQTFEWTVPEGAPSAVHYFSSSDCGANMVGAIIVIPPPKQVFVFQLENTFHPSEITVHKGDKIRWVRSSGSHTVTSGSNCTADGIFHSPLDGDTQSFLWTVPDDAPASIPYFSQPDCKHNMNGTVTVASDADKDGVYDHLDNCPDTHNPDQADCNDNGIGDVCDEEDCPLPCPADITDDAMVNVNDLLEVIGAWGQTGSPADVTGDGVVGIEDLLEVISMWGPCPTA